MSVYLDPQIIAKQMEANAAFSFLLEYVKNSSRFSFITCSSKRLNQVLGIIASGLIALGISYNYSYDAALDGGTLTLVLGHISIGSLWTGLTQWFFSFLTQQGIYKGLVKGSIKEDVTK